MSTSVHSTPIVFSADAGERVQRVGKIFALGAHTGSDPQRGGPVPFELDEAAADAAIAAFTPAPLELEHFHTQGKRSILDGKLGTLQRVWRDGATVLGAVDIPAWLDPIWAEAGRKISAVWDTDPKRLTGAGLVLEPAISDAALFSAYATFAGARHSANDAADMQAVHDISVRQGAACAPPPAQFSEGNPTMPEPTDADFLVKLKAFFSGGPASDPPPPDPAIAALQAQLATQAAQLQAQQALFATEQAASRLREATAFVDAHSPARIPPYARGLYIADLAQALADDAAAAAQVTFSNATGATQAASRAELKRQAILALPVVQFGGVGTFTPAPGQTLLAVPGVTPPPPAPDPDAPPSAERREELLQMTPLGREVLATQHTNGHQQN